MARISYLTFIFLYFFVSSVESALQTVNGKIHMTLGVSGGCSDAARLIQNQLGQTYELYKEFLDIEFVPWGRTVRDANGTLDCFFGPNDCFANRLQRCVLSLLAGNPDAQVQYMTCEYSPPFPSFRQRSYQCALSLGLNLVEVDYCFSTPIGDALESPAEQISIPAVQTINFIPFIIFNNNIDVAQHAQAYRRLQSTICFALADDPTTGITHCKL